MTKLSLRIGFWSLFIWLVVACAPLSAQSPLPVEEDPSPATAPPAPAAAVMAAVAASPTTVPEPATATLPPATVAPPATATRQPTSTVTSAPTATATAVPSLTPTAPPDRTCPETTPLKPAYDRFYLSGDRWPAPDETIARPHFWLSKPLGGGGRLLFNQRFPYGWDESGRLLLHNGIDIAEKLGTPVLAVADGTVVVAQPDINAWYGWRCDWYGHLVVIELDQRWQDKPVYALYGHVLNLMVEPGQRVLRGEPVAEVGFGGAATHPHLHFEVRVGENEFGSTRNPVLWIDPGPTRGVVVGRLVDPEGRPWQGVPLTLIPTDGSGETTQTWSYLGDPDDIARPDEGWAENFTFGDVKPGLYELYTSILDVEYRLPVTVSPGELTVVELQTEPYDPNVPAPVQPDATPAGDEPPLYDVTPLPAEAVPTVLGDILATLPAELSPPTIELPPADG